MQQLMLHFTAGLALLAGASQADAADVTQQGPAAEIPTGEGSMTQWLANWAIPARGPLVRPQPTCAATLEPSFLPVVGRETSAFGRRFDPLGAGWRFHAGIDLAAPSGSPVTSVRGGSVLRAAWAQSYGNLVVIDHGNGITTRYAHLKRSLVHAGDVVGVGQPIGLVGATGRTTGSHLHFEVRLHGQALDPKALAPDVIAADCLDLPGMAPPLPEVELRSGWSGAGGDETLPIAILR